MVTDAGITCLAHQCLPLQYSILERCASITDTSIIRLAEGCPDLRHLNLNICDNITNLSAMWHQMQEKLAQQAFLLSFISVVFVLLCSFFLC
jgi:hypothetical protein